ncbi:hypothetical protein BU25DRAFT_423362 [Macroventuria anomochaeta]|uniref:Uncharacterized protein n=1 Tax=Macroventuria anomochaeta TaxID=301207 RepID=A0ACB6RVW1_9PLEO|nr:uncharacterized protein BU25DRAFT_423362 [Macroventuria anomochaeta]KAF2625274.1 hypothetical protein BU25DRAFT_423362 [Macroventuria anomochaeta]
MRSSVVLSLLLPAIVSASPVVDQKALNALFCKVNNFVIHHCACQRAVATTYCPKFIGIVTSTISKTTTQIFASATVTVTTTSTGGATTTTLTNKETITTYTTVTDTTTSTWLSAMTLTTSTVTATYLNSAYTAGGGVGPVKRAVKATKPTCTPTTWSTAYVSTVCSCLSIPTPSTTRTAIVTLAQGTTTITNIAVVTLSSTAITVVIVTYTSTDTISITTVGSSTVIAYATATTIASDGPQCRKYPHSYNANLQNSGFISNYFKGATSELNGYQESVSFRTSGLQLYFPDKQAFYGAE